MCAVLFKPKPKDAYLNKLEKLLARLQKKNPNKCNGKCMLVKAATSNALASDMD